MNVALLCDEGVNSFVTRAIKKMMISTKEQGKNTTLFVVGEKGRSQLARIHADVSILDGTINYSGVLFCKRAGTNEKDANTSNLWRSLMSLVRKYR